MTSSWTKILIHALIWFQYVLETYCEARSTKRVFKPWRGEQVDGPEFGIPPGPWQIHVPPQQDFLDHKQIMPVPHTSYLRVSRDTACGTQNPYVHSRCSLMVTSWWFKGVLGHSYVIMKLALRCVKYYLSGVIEVTWHDLHVIKGHWKIDCLFNSLLKLAS